MHSHTWYTSSCRNAIEPTGIIYPVCRGPERYSRDVVRSCLSPVSTCYDSKGSGPELGGKLVRNTAQHQDDVDHRRNQEGQ